MVDPSNEWNRYELMVVNRLDALDKNYKELHVGLENLRVEIATLKVHGTMRYALVGLVGGLVPSLAALIYFLAN